MSARDLIIGNKGFVYPFVGTSATAPNTWQSGYRNIAQDITCDLLGNTYTLTLFLYNYSNQDDIFTAEYIVTKFNKYGTVQWQKALTAANYYTYGNPDYSIRGYIRVSGQGNIYIITTDAVPNVATMLTKIDSSGSIVWQRTLAPAVYITAPHYPGALWIDSFENVFCINCYRPGSTPATYFIYKINSSGTLLNCKEIYTISGSLQQLQTGLVGDASGNIYITYMGATGDSVLAKVNSSFTLQWQRKLANGSGQFGSYLTYDGSGNLYYSNYNPANTLIYIIKYDTSGTLIWQKSANIPGGVYPFGVGGIQADGNAVYVQGAYQAAVGYTSFIIKLDTSGVTQWARKVGGTFVSSPYAYAAFGEGMGLYLDPDSGLFFSGTLEYASSGNMFYYGTIFGNLPVDGSKTGSYSNSGNLTPVTYTSTTVTISDTTFTEAAASATYLGGSFTIYSLAYTWATPTYTINNTFTAI